VSRLGLRRIRCPGCLTSPRNPHITFWKVLDKRHTKNFAVEAMRVNFTGAPTYGQRVVAVVNRNADLVWNTYVEVALPDTTTDSGVPAGS
jgi:hypothetical protein